MHTDSTVTREVRDGVCLIGLNRPHKYNAFHLQMLQDLAVAFTRYEEDPALRCAVLFGHGEHFTTGLDLAEVGPAVRSGASLFPPDLVDPLGLGQRRRTKPLVVAVQGWCLTIGIELMLAADIRVAARNTRMGQIEVKRGLFPFGGATVRWPAMTGWGNAMRYLLTGDLLDGAEACRIGLVQELAPTGTQLDVALGLAQRVALQAPLGISATLSSARIARDVGPEAALARLLPQARELMESEDAAEGIESFVERRPAAFAGH